MHPSVRMIASGLVAGAVSGACFDFDATMAGGPYVDSGVTAADARVDEAQADAPADASVDARDSASADDGGGVTDSGAPQGVFCRSLTPSADGGLFFCDDFDEHPLPGSWQTWLQMAGTMIETDASAVSPPTSVDETTIQLANGQAVNVALRTTMPVPAVPATLRLAFQVQPVQIDPTAGAAVVLGAIDFLDGSGDRYTVGLAINVAGGQAALALGEQSSAADGAPPTFVDHPLSTMQPLPMNTWSEVVIEVDWGATSVEGQVIVGGSPELAVPLAMSVAPTSLQIGVGTSFVTTYDGGLSPVWELRYDNVVFTSQ